MTPTPIAFALQLQRVTKRVVQYLTLPHVYVVHQLVHPVQVFIVIYQPTHAAVATLVPTLMDQKKILSIVHVVVTHAMI